MEQICSVAKYQYRHVGAQRGALSRRIRSRVAANTRVIAKDIMQMAPYKCDVVFSRSMGILLPPVAQVTSSTGNHLTLHHRNRSLDSALQRIPEVDVTPSPECETVTAMLSVEPADPSKTTQRDELASLGSDDSGILCGSDSGSSDATRESSVEFLSNEHRESRESLDSDGCESVVTKVEDECDRSEPSKSFGMLRLLESRVFDVSMAMHYLFKSKEPGVQSYIANRMFSFDDHEVDFYLPQLVCMYIQMHDVAEVIHPYLIH
ncbi:hypothetical protein BDFB_005454, partial [Asbolus verrucosus]